MSIPKVNLFYKKLILLYYNKYTGGQNMTEEARAARRAYKREWNRKNKDKVKAAQERYWTRKAEAAAQDQRAAGTIAQEV